MGGHINPRPQRLFSPALALPLTALALALLACAVNLSSKDSPPAGPGGLELTQTAMSIQQTAIAGQNSALAAAQTAAAAQATLPPTPDLPATQAALAAQLTQAAPAPLPVALDTPVLPTDRPSQPAPQASPAPPQDDAGFEAWKKDARILVYEDIVVDSSVVPYLRKLLPKLGLEHEWVGNAMGKLKDGMLYENWDLIIIAAETRSGVSGEYFDYMRDVLDKGTPFVLEAWYLDRVYQGAVGPILDQCGVAVDPYVPTTKTTNDVTQYALVDSHPILDRPNSGLTFTEGYSFWLRSGDLGSLMSLTGAGDAQLLLGIDRRSRQQGGTLATCLDGLLTLQTFSSHSFPYDVMAPLWENMIDKALRVRYANRR
ncbi:MAG: hypothetical protein ACKOC5_18820 [Chloroflexota bacterium]